MNIYRDYLYCCHTICVTSKRPEGAPWRASHRPFSNGMSDMGYCSAVAIYWQWISVELGIDNCKTKQWILLWMLEEVTCNLIWRLFVVYDVLGLFFSFGFPKYRTFIVSKIVFAAKMKAKKKSNFPNWKSDKQNHIATDRSAHYGLRKFVVRFLNQIMMNSKYPIHIVRIWRHENFPSKLDWYVLGRLHEREGNVNNQLTLLLKTNWLVAVSKWK